MENMLGILAADERVRAERLRLPKDQADFILTRGMLRNILSRYLSTGPKELRFRYTKYGKPYLTGLPGVHPLRFNVSHSKGYALFAIASGRQVGVDLEWIQPDFASGEIAERFFTRGEVAALRSLPRHLHNAAFFDYWTRKEAYIKAVGKGLSIPLDQFEVSLKSEDTVVLLNANGKPQEATHWILRQLYPLPGFAAALAVEGTRWKLRCWHSPH